MKKFKVWDDAMLRLISTMKPDGCLICQHNSDGTTGYHSQSQDGRYSPKAATVERAISLGIIKPVEDGLFVGCSQTFRLAIDQ